MSCARYYSPLMRARLMVGMVPEWLHKHPRATYIIQATLSCPPWVKREELYRFRDEAERLTRETGVRHVVDHQIPLNHPRVCGLTVPWNLAVIPWAVNARKGNRWNPDQLEMFDDAES